MAYMLTMKSAIGIISDVSWKLEHKIICNIRHSLHFVLSALVLFLTCNLHALFTRYNVVDLLQVKN